MSDMELEFTTLADDPTALERLPAEQGLTGGGCEHLTCGPTCDNVVTCTDMFTCSPIKSRIVPVP